MPRASSDLGITENDVIVRVKRNGDFEELKNDALAELKDSPALQDIEDEVWKEAESATLWESRRDSGSQPLLARVMAAVNRSDWVWRLVDDSVDNVVHRNFMLDKLEDVVDDAFDHCYEHTPNGPSRNGSEQPAGPAREDSDGDSIAGEELAASGGASPRGQVQHKHSETEKPTATVDAILAIANLGTGKAGTPASTSHRVAPTESAVAKQAKQQSACPISEPSSSLRASVTSLESAERPKAAPSIVPQARLPVSNVSLEAASEAAVDGDLLANDSDISDVSSVNTDDLSSSDDGDSPRTSPTVTPSSAKKGNKKRTKRVAKSPTTTPAGTVSGSRTKRKAEADETESTSSHAKKSRSNDEAVEGTVWDNTGWFEVAREGFRLQAMDGPNWYDAKIVKVDKVAQRVEINYIGWNKRYNRWFSAKSSAVRFARKLSD
eukprot:m.60567 g.60567  ORF g.60567 m.60567 type:complete len:436 (+) comp9513_c0_seq2:302-1609(+)